MQISAPTPAPLLLSAELRAQFLEALRVRGCTARYIGDVARYLARWGEQLAGVDLRELSLPRQVLPALEQASCRGARVAALKACTAWLTRERFELAHDPCAALKVPQARPEQWRRPKVVELYRLDQVLARLELPWRDCMTVLLGTGWHLTELQRFVRAGAILTPTMRTYGTAAVLETVHKHGRTFRTPVTACVRRSAVRVRARGHVDLKALRRHVYAAAAAAGVARFRLGELRHTVATYAAQRVGLERTADFLGHRDPRTTERFYVLHYTPAKVPTPR